jgi:hypothetical protein
VVEELAEEGRSGGVVGVVAVVHALRGVGDQQHRADVEVVAGVHDAAHLADVGQCRPPPVVGGDERAEVGEDPPEPVGRGREGLGCERLLTLHHAGDGAPRTHRDGAGGARADPGEESAPAHPRSSISLPRWLYSHGSTSVRGRALRTTCP